MDNRIKYFDIAKGIAIICVIIGHTVSTGLINKGIYSFHMPLFFLISGYFLKKNISVKFIKRKIKQLIIPYIFTCVFVMMLSFIKYTIKENFYSGIIITLKLLYASFYCSGMDYNTPFVIVQIGAIWFLPALFLSLIMTNFLINKKYGIIMILAGAFIGYETSKIIWLPFSIQSALVANIFVYLGWYFKNYTVFEKYNKKYMIILAILIWGVCIFFAGKLDMVNNFYESGIINILGAICGVYIVILLSKFFDENKYRISNVLVKFGRNSLIILCFHLVEMKLIPWWSTKSYLEHIYGINSSFIIISFILIKLLIAILAIMIVRKNQYMSKIFDANIGRQ